MIQLVTNHRSTYVTWRGCYLRSAEPSEFLGFDEYACRKTEEEGLLPTMKPGRARYVHHIHQARRLMLLRFLQPRNANKSMLLWSPPRTNFVAENQLLAEMLECMMGGEPLAPDDARYVLALHTEKMEAEAEKLSIHITYCKAPIVEVYYTMDATAKELGLRGPEDWNQVAFEQVFVNVLRQWQRARVEEDMKNLVIEEDPDNWD